MTYIKEFLVEIVLKLVVHLHIMRIHKLVAVHTIAFVIPNAHQIDGRFNALLGGEQHSLKQKTKQNIKSPSIHSIGEDE